ncbi:hypothetical protein [Labrys wisconsinensis]|uniref:Toxin-antitoxin system HicB family antitoxin n=1 Tax=Labrys wisconsinensis TaxID=425677 RepID=A0ABU0JC74_9HYPH|nr:hypothetical protein [Labrys wisconsinensis]MDQ0471878.1 hypothetical protein [Labrys wisconsinensis]
MAITIDLPPEIEANLAARAAASGVSLHQYLLHLLEEQAPVRPDAPLSPAERAALWRQSALNLPRTRPLPDAAISREAIYEPRG